MENINYDSDKRKILSAVSHGSIFFSQLLLSAGVPIAVMVLSDDPIVKENSREALNFHLNVWVYSIIFGILAVVLIGWPFLIALGIAQFVLPILAILKSVKEPEGVFKYPFIFRVL